MKTKDIKKELRKNSFILKLLKLQNNYALYSLEKNNKIYGFEIHKLRKIKVHDSALEIHSGFDYYWRNPSNNEFGVFGWSFENYKNAIKFFEEVQT
jgi:hypothetical protein